MLREVEDTTTAIGEKRKHEDGRGCRAYSSWLYSTPRTPSAQLSSRYSRIPSIGSCAWAWAEALNVEL